MKWRYWGYTGQWSKIYDGLLKRRCPFDQPKILRDLKEVIGTRLYQSTTTITTAQEDELNALWKALVSNRTVDSTPGTVQPLPKL